MMGTGDLVTATELAGVPTIDGDCNSPSGEYSGAASASNPDMSFFAGLRSDSNYLYICVRVTADSTGDLADTGELLFDQDNNGGTLPDANDRLFRVISGGAFTQMMGNTVTWVPCGGSCASGNSGNGTFDGTNEVYEFKIAFSDVWGPSPPQRAAGFAIVAQDISATKTYTWGSPTVSESDPSTWGQIEIPEFGDFLLVSVSVLVLLGIQLRRRRS